MAVRARKEEDRLRIDVVRVELVRERRASFAGTAIRGPRDVARLI